MQLKVSNGPFTEAFWNKFLPNNKAAHEKADFDSGWIATPGDKVIQHNLGKLPREVWVYASDSPGGDPFSSDTWTACTSSQITITGAKAYCYVRMNIGA